MVGDRGVGNPSGARTGWRWVLLAGMGALAAIALWTVLVRATVPVSLDADVTETYARNRNSGGADIYFVRLTDDRVLLVDRHVAESIPDGAHVEKARWSFTLQVDDRAVGLWRARELGRMVLLMGTALVVVAVLTVRRDRVDHLLTGAAQDGSDSSQL